MKTIHEVGRQLLFVFACGAAVTAFADEIQADKAADLEGPAIIARPSPPAPAAMKTEVEWQGSWYPAQVLKQQVGKFFIKYDGYTDEWNEWVGKDRIRFSGKPAEPSPAEVEWQGTWYPAQVLKQAGGEFFVKYDGYTDDWNEWVGKDRIRFPEPAANPSQTASPGQTASQGQTEVEWRGMWFPAQILEIKFRIKYDGYDDSWNEWVGPERIRFRTTADKTPAK